MLNITLQSKLDKNALLSTKFEDNFKLALRIMPSQRLRTIFKQGGHAYNRGVDYCVVIDKTCDRLSEITEAIRRLSFSIKHNDTLSLVTYSDAPQVIMDSLKSMDAIKKINDITVIQSDSKESNLYIGLKQSRELMLSKGSERIKKVLLISGLRKNLNYKEEELLNNEIENYKYSNISVDILAIGEDSNLFILENIASVLGGQCHLINSTSDICKAAVDSLRYCQESILINVKLRMKLNNKYFRLKHMYRGLPTNAYLGKGNGKDEVVININNMHIDKMQLYYFDITSRIPKLGVTGDLVSALIRVEYSLPADGKNPGGIRQGATERVKVEFVNDPSKIRQNPSIINHYYETEIKRLESMMLDNKKRDEKEAVIYAYNQIIKIYQEIGNAKLAKQYRDSLEEYKSFNIITMKVASESSKSSINDSLPVL